jgi:hypothetical protein
MAAEWGQSKLRFKAILLPSFSCHQKWEAEAFSASPDDRLGGSDSLFQTPATCELARVERRELGRFGWQKNGWQKMGA